MSVLSGVQRRDIRQLDDAALVEAQPKTPSIASQVFTRWLTDAALRSKRDEPMPLPKNGAAPSFDALAREMSSDVHPRTLLAEMQRLGLVRIDGDTVHLQAQAFVPQRGFDEMVDLFAANASDHLAAAAHNLRGDGDKFLEQSVFASGVSARSTQALRRWRASCGGRRSSRWLATPPTPTSRTSATATPRCACASACTSMPSRSPKIAQTARRARPGGGAPCRGPKQDPSAQGRVGEHTQDRRALTTPASHQRFQPESNMTRITTKPAWIAAIGAALALLLGGCGGRRRRFGRYRFASLGTVDGFGSILIGGERCDDSARASYTTP